MPDLLIEVGCEELPSTACHEIVEQAPGLVASSLAALGLEGSALTVSVAPAPVRGARARPARRHGPQRPGGPRPVGGRGVRARRRPHQGRPGLRPRPGRGGGGPGRARAAGPRVRVRGAPQRGAPPGRAGARGGRAPGGGAAVLQDHALGRRHRPSLLPAGPLDRGQGQRAHRALRSARPDGRGREPGPPLPGRPGDDRLGVRLRRRPPGRRRGGEPRRPAGQDRRRPRRGRQPGGRLLARSARGAGGGRVPGRVAQRHRRTRSTSATWSCPRGCW